MRRTFLAPALLASALVLGVGPTQAAPGDLDPGFGKGGKIRTVIGTTEDSANAIAIQADGMIVAAGTSSKSDVSTSRVFGLVRYKANGSLDRTFGSGGKVMTAIDQSASGSDVAIQPDGKIVVAGESFTGSQSLVALARYDASGRLDPSFGSGGKVRAAFGSDSAAALAVAIQADGKIVVAGVSGTLDGSQRRFALARFKPDGALDPSFGSSGKIEIPIGQDLSAATAVAIQADGKIVAAGFTFSSRPGDVALARVDADGALDPTFGSGGKVTTPIGPNGGDAYALALQPDGKIVVTGASFTARHARVALARYEASGTLDPTFGSGGKVTTIFGSVGDSQASAIAIQPDGRIVVAGGSSKLKTVETFGLARYQPNGSLDTSFGSKGTVTTAIGSESWANAVAIQADGKVVAAGGSYDGRKTAFALARYLDEQALCVVPKVTRKPLGRAKRAVVRSHCSVGRIERKFSTRLRKGRVISQKPKAGARRLTGAKVSLLVSKGKR